MRTPTLKSFILLGLLSACSDHPAPLAPEADDPGTPVLAANGATVEGGTGVYSENGPVYLDCVGEVVEFDATVEYRYRSVTTPGGRGAFVWSFILHSQEGTAVGQTSGTVWTSALVASPEVDRPLDGSDSSFFTSNQIWVSETGPTMHLHTRFHVSTNAAGQVMVDQFDFSCQTM